MSKLNTSPRIWRDLIFVLIINLVAQIILVAGGITLTLFVVIPLQLFAIILNIKSIIQINFVVTPSKSWNLKYRLGQNLLAFFMLIYFGFDSVELMFDWIRQLLYMALY